MKKLHFDYCMSIAYSDVVSKCSFTIKCIPKSNARQLIENIEIGLKPPVEYNKGTDSLGNLQIYGRNTQKHKDFIFRLSGSAITGLSDFDDLSEDENAMIFRHPHGLNQSGTCIRNYFERLKLDKGADVITKADMLMHCLYRDFSYCVGQTTIRTTAEEAFELGSGVCQDYAHIYISLLHLAGISARYVTGLLLGEGASHAWVEVLCGGKWYGFDPTNGIRVTDEHIKIGVGRDAFDCMLNRGIMMGGGTQKQHIRVIVKETGEE